VIREILVPVRGDGKGDNVLAHASALARRFKSHVVVTHCRPRPQDLLPYGVPVPTFLKDQLQKQAIELANQVEKSLKSEFDMLVQKFDLTVSDDPIAGTATATWVEEEGRQVEVAGMLGVNSLKAALFHTGRPVLLCPPTDTPPVQIGTHIVIAWNGSTEAARAVALNIGLLEDATTVTILTGGEEVYGTTSEDLASYLRNRGITAEIERFSAHHNVGKELLERCRTLGADLMVMGAYGDSHEKEIMFGGNTQTIIESTSIPVVLVH